VLNVFKDIIKTPKIFNVIHAKLQTVKAAIVLINAYNVVKVTA
jgi:hypothetical protein